MVARGIPTRQIQAATGLSAAWIYTLCRRYSEGGLAQLGDRRAQNGGHQRLLSDAELDTLRSMLATPPRDGGAWTSPKVAAWMSRVLGRTVSSKVAWEYIQRVGYSLQAQQWDGEER